MSPWYFAAYTICMIAAIMICYIVSDTNRPAK